MDDKYNTEIDSLSAGLRIALTVNNHLNLCNTESKGNYYKIDIL